MAIVSWFRIKNWFLAHERHVSSFSLLAGFIIDNITLQRIDLLFENLILVSYLVISGGSIALYNLHKGGAFQSKILEKIGFLLPVAIQFAFGGLFSGFIVFYSRSASLLTSWPFLVVLVSILITGELVRTFYTRLHYQMTVFFAALFLFLIFYVPVITARMNEWMFLLSGLLSIIFFFLFYRFLSLKIPDLVATYKKGIVMSVSLVYIVINLFYFLNILPPIPLSLKDGGVYHSVTRTETGYVLEEEEDRFWDMFRPFAPVHIRPGQSVYAFSSVFAPTNLEIPIVHEWQYYDKEKLRWVTANAIIFPITGGSDGGYKGYSFKNNVFPGTWRVNVSTERGQIIGRLKFKIFHESGAVPLKTLYK
jgi:hypothetical protein